MVTLQERLIEAIGIAVKYLRLGLRYTPIISAAWIIHPCTQRNNTAKMSSVAR